ncbi:TonB-dependent receptor [Pseudomonas sp. Marseille-Q8238]
MQQFQRTCINTAVLIALAGSVYSWPTLASAQTATKPKDSTLGVVTVTAQKRSESVQEVPLTVNVVDGKTLEDSGAGLTAGEITRFIPNASAATLDNHGFPRWFLRGIGTGQPTLDNVSPIGYYVDEVYLGPIFLSGGPLYDIERVEVLPGPQGTLWGKNSPGGAIHVVSRKPTFDNSGYVKAGAGNFNKRLLQGALNGVLVEDKLATRLSFTSENRDQYAKNQTKDKRGELEDQGVRWQLFGTLSDSLDAHLSVHHREYTQDENTSYITFGPPGSQDARGNPYPQFPKRNYSFNAPTESKHIQSGGVLTFNWDLDGYTLTSISGYEKGRSTSESDGDNSPQEVSRSYGRQEVDLFSQELRLASPRSDRLNWITGVHYYYQDMENFSAGGSLNVPDLYPGTVPNYNNNEWTGENESLGVFASATYNFTDDFNLTAGVRWTDERKEIQIRRQRANNANYTDTNHWWKRGSVSNPLTTYVSYDDDRRWREVTWDVTPEYRINDNLRTYLRVAKGFRGGGYISAPTSQAATGNFDPEFITSYELGLKSEWFDGRLIANASVFYYDYDDIQINIYRWDPALNTGTSRMQNAASASVQGAEFEIQALPIENLRVRLSGGFLDTEYKDYRADGAGGAPGADYSGTSFARSPRLSGVLGFDYSVPLPYGKVVLGGDINSRSRFHFSAPESKNPAQQHPGYTLTNLRATYVFPGDNVEVSAYVDNVTDKDYWQATSPVGPDIVGYALGAPRTFGTSVQVNW